MTTGSAAEALDILGQLRDGPSQVSLVLADLWLPGATGTELLAQVRQLDPAAKRVLLIAWGDQASSEPILQAIVLGYIDAYVVKPATAPDERFHRVITEQLDEWGLLNLPGFEAVREARDAPRQPFRIFWGFKSRSTRFSRCRTRGCRVPQVHGRSRNASRPRRAAPDRTWSCR
jgi:CheY-like chemotaxis protein